jgi:ribosomal protein S18 acetylase RimI-like enzyme
MTEIRTGTPGDLEAALVFWRLAGDPSPTDSMEALTSLLDRDPGALLIATSGEQLVGTLIAAWDGWRGSLYRLAVHPARRRSGIATALVDAGEERLRQLGAVRLTAIVIDGDATAAALWQAVGYERQAKRARFVRMLDTDSRSAL